MPKTQVRQSSNKSFSSSDDSKRKGRALADALSFLKEQWGWSGAKIQDVIHIPATTVNSWIQSGYVNTSDNFSNDVQAILHLIVIHKDLDSMFEQPEDQLLWLNTFHPDIGEAPLETMKRSIEGLIGIRQYLDYVRGRGA